MDKESITHLPYKNCAVPMCKNTIKTAPHKIFIHVPKNEEIRKKWFELAGMDTENFSVLSTRYFCEDHFQLDYDMKNYMEYRTVGKVSQVMMNPGCVPTKFESKIEPPENPNLSRDIRTYSRKSKVDGNQASSSIQFQANGEIEEMMKVETEIPSEDTDSAIIKDEDIKRIQFESSVKGRPDLDEEMCSDSTKKKMENLSDIALDIYRFGNKMKKPPVYNKLYSNLHKEKELKEEKSKPGKRSFKIIQKDNVNDLETTKNNAVRVRLKLKPNPNRNIDVAGPSRVDFDVLETLNNTTMPIFSEPFNLGDRVTIIRPRKPNSRTHKNMVQNIENMNKIKDFKNQSVVEIETHNQDIPEIKQELDDEVEIAMGSCGNEYVFSDPLLPRVKEECVDIKEECETHADTEIDEKPQIDEKKIKEEIKDSENNATIEISDDDEETNVFKLKNSRCSGNMMNDLMLVPSRDVCAVCDMFVPNRFTEHMETFHRDGLYFVCPLCETDRRFHYKVNEAPKHWVDGILHCQFCDDKFHSWFDLNKHVSQTHSNKVEKKCQFCGLETEYYMGLLMHILSQHGGESLIQKCPYCEFETLNTSLMQVHQKVKHTLKEKCLWCGFSTLTPSLMLEHIQAKHSRVGRIPKIRGPKKNKVRKCPVCACLLTSVKLYKEHLKKKHRVD